MGLIRIALRQCRRRTGSVEEGPEKVKMVPATLLLILTLFMNHPSSAAGSLQTCRSRQVTSLKNYVTSSWMISQTQGSRVSSMTCAQLCLREERCVSFLYNDVTRDCRLFAVVKSVSDVTSAAVGYRYYDTCRATGYYGASCSVDSNCRLTNTRCFDGRCRCQEGHSFDPKKAMCVTKCTSYGPEFEKIPRYFITSNNEEYILGLGAQACLEKCVQATSYVCRSVDLRVSPDPACSLASVTKSDVQAHEWMNQGAWVTDHYQRHCSL